MQQKSKLSEDKSKSKKKKKTSTKYKKVKQMVEPRRFELLTPCVQSRCSTN